jgi:hypothetical protein
LFENNTFRLGELGNISRAMDLPRASGFFGATVKLGTKKLCFRYIFAIIIPQ